MLGLRDDRASRILKQRKDNVRPMNYDDLDEHMKKYDAQKRINEFKQKEIYGITGTTIAMKTGERHF